MRNLLFTLCAVISIQTISAQTVKIYKDGDVLSNVVDADSIVYTENEISDCLMGAFSVSPTKKVHFSQGNLQYNQKTKHWRFATNQYDFTANENNHIGENSYDGYLDLFGWSTASTYFGINSTLDTYGWLYTSGDIMDPEYMTYFSQFTGEFVDWGKNIQGADWYTLSSDEWTYLRNTRTNADQLCGIACVNGNNGLIFLPDNWVLPEGLTFNPGFSSPPSTESKYAEHNNYTLNQWQLLEAAGAVFLPVAGYREGKNYDSNNMNWGAKYWSSTPTDPTPYDYESKSTHSDAFAIISEIAEVSWSSNCVGCCVRLVCNAQ